MAERLSRRQLYDLVWSEPLRSLSARFGISDVALKKTCQRARIPTPERGYWAKKEGGQKTVVPPLPERPPAMEDEVLVGGGHDYWYRRWTTEELLDPLPPAPEFNTPLEAVRERIAKAVGKVTIPGKVRIWHPAIQRLLQEDETSREKQRTSPYSHFYSHFWHNPLFDSPLERRRLRLLNGLFLTVERFNGKAAPDKDARKSVLTFYKQHVHIALGPSKEILHGANSSAQASGDCLALAISETYGSGRAIQYWRDEDGSKLECQMTEIAVQVVMLAEERYRESAVRRYQWRIERKAELEERERIRTLEAERAEIERARQLEKARVDRLLRDAAAFQQASMIRSYVEAIRLTQSSSTSTSAKELERWSQWALAEADRIDPSIDTRFLAVLHDEENHNGTNLV